jgi:uncharacterized membrane protein
VELVLVGVVVVDVVVVTTAEAREIKLVVTTTAAGEVCNAYWGNNCGSQ